MKPAQVKSTIPISALEAIDIRVGTIESIHDVPGCELATACCLALGRLVSRLATGSQLDPASARETVVVETLPGHPSVTVALPLFDLSRPQSSSPPS